MIPFTKAHGIGNDFVLVRDSELPAGFDVGRWAVAVCDRRFGVGADGVIVAVASASGLEMRMWNPDGTPSEMCGNGLRCFAVFVRSCGLANADTFDVQMGSRKIAVRMESERVAVNMGAPDWGDAAAGVTGPVADERFGAGHTVAMGNPHLVFVVPSVSEIAVDVDGPRWEHDGAFAHRTNVHWIAVAGANHLVQRTWERGAGETLACGSGACACFAVANREGLVGDSAEIDLPGGRLHIAYEGDEIWMTGPAEISFTGEWPQ